MIARPWGGDFWGGGERFLPWGLTRRWAPALRGRGRGGLKDASRSPPAPHALAGRFGLCLALVQDGVEAVRGWKLSALLCPFCPLLRCRPS